MHSSETAPAPLASGPGLLHQLGRLIIRARSSSPAPLPAPRDRLHPKVLVKPSTSQQVQQVQPKPRESGEPSPSVEHQLISHVDGMWNDQIPVCIEVLLAPECAACSAALAREDCHEKHRRAVLLERWTMRSCSKKGQAPPAFITSQWLLNAVRSQLHFSQLSAWLARLKASEDCSTERRRKLSRETCNYKKLESNCDSEQASEKRKLNVVYSIKTPGDSYSTAFSQPPSDHVFPVTDIGDDSFLKINLESLPRLNDIPTVKCFCPKRRTSRDGIPQDLVGKLNDLTLDSKAIAASRPFDDRMLTPCSENGKHRCSCDEESDGNGKTHPKKLDERRLKEIAKYKRRLRKEMRKRDGSTSSEGDGIKKETHTSIPILQAARFDRFRAIGCYRNQTYLTLPASRVETRTPFVENDPPAAPEFKKTNTVGTQTEDSGFLDGKCEGCGRGMVRSDANYNLASLQEKGERSSRRKFDDDDDDKSLKKPKCDNSIKCDSNISSVVVRRPKFRRSAPIFDRIERIVSDRHRGSEDDIADLHLKSDDTVFSVPKETKRQKTFSIGEEEYVLYEKCDYGTFDRCEAESPQSESPSSGFKFPDPKKGVDNQVPSPSEMDRFRWRFDSAASMVFNAGTGLPLTSSPAPLRRGNNCFDFDDSINGISGIKSALFHPISPTPAAPVSPASPMPTPRAPPPPRKDGPKLRMGPSTGLLGSFEESALKGRLEPAATVHGFTAELGASGAFCPAHRRLPVTVFFYAPGGTNAPYMGHINLGAGGYRVARSGTVQVSLFNPHGTLVKMFVVLYELTGMPPMARTFLRQRTLYMPAGSDTPAPAHVHKWLRYLIHLRFMTSKSGKLYLHTDIRILVSRKADLDTATAHSALFRPICTNQSKAADDATQEPANQSEAPANDTPKDSKPANRAPNRVFGGCGEYDSEFRSEMREFGYDNQNGVSYELRSFTYAPDNPKYSPR